MERILLRSEMTRFRKEDQYLMSIDGMKINKNGRYREKQKVK